jgi:acyl-CoA dehydrogenase
MLYPESEKVKSLKGRLESFMDRYVYPNEERYVERWSRRS